MNNIIHVNGACVPPGKGRYRHCISQTIKYCIVMKLFLAILVFNMNVSLAAFSQRIDINVKNQSFRDVMTTIREQTGYSFFFATPLIKNANPVTLTLKNATIEETLQKICEGQPFTFIIKDKAILLQARKEKSEPSTSKEIKKADIRGVVRDHNGRPLVGATVMISGRNNMGTSTNEKGEFFLSGVPESGKLLITMIGFGSREISYTPDISLQVTLNPVETNMDEIQVIGYGTISKRLNTGNVGTLKGIEVGKQSINNPLLALQGRIAGVEINQVNGISGGTVRINIRGINTLREGTTAPLFVIDGVPYISNLFNTPGNQGLSSGLTGGGGLNPLSLINPKDIESIDVLKDADATAIYGSRAANGVVLITTKKGTPGETKVDVNFQTGMGNVTRRAALLNTQQYISMRKEAFTNDKVTPTVNNAKDLLTWDQNAYTDWQDVMIGGTSKYTNAQASISGGNENTQYLIGSNYYRETTVFPGTWSDNKASVHFNINNTSTNQRLKVALSGSFLADNNSLPGVDFTQFITTAPNAPSHYNSDGTLDWINFPNNPFSNLFKTYRAKSQNLVANSVIGYQVLPNLELKSSFGYNGILLNEKQAFKISSNSPSSGVATGSAAFNTNTVKSWIVEPQLNYHKVVGPGMMNILIGGTIQQRLIEGQVIIGVDYTDDDMLGSLAAANNSFKGNSVYEEYKYASVFSRVNYNIADKYLLNLTARRDGSSRFGPGKQYGNFGAIGAAWVFSQENFFKKMLPFVSFGKLRASYGTSGNEPGVNYAFLELYNITPSLPYGGGVGISPRGLQNANFRWELNKKAELGLELAFLEDRFTLTASAYRNRSGNQLFSSPLPSSVGFGGIISNIPATIQNSGFEFTLNSTNIKNNNFQWSSGLNFSRGRNKLIDFPSLETSGWGSVFAIGQPINVRRLYESAGVDPVTGRYLFYDNENKTTLTPLSPKDAKVILDVNPKYFGGLQNTITFKDFTLDFNFQFVKTKGISYLFASSLPPGRFQTSNGLGNQPLDVLDRWTPENPNSSFQKFSQGSEANSSYSTAKLSNLIFSDASFIRLKNAYLSYRLPDQLTNKLKLSNLRIYVQGQNLLTLTGYKGADPETRSITALPPLRIFMAGIQITL